MPPPLPFKVQPSEFEVRSSLLNAFLAEVWGRSYQLGQWDCILFIAAWADRLQGTETFTPQLRGHYSTEREGLAIFTARTGINAAIAATLTAHGWHEVPLRRGDTPVPGHLHPGDIILTDLHHPGIYDGHAILAHPARSCGLLLLHPSHGVLALRWPV